jgi:hypothetical protein
MDKERAEAYKIIGLMLGRLIHGFMADCCRLLIVVVVCGGWLWVIYILYVNPTWPTGIAATGAPAMMYWLVKSLFPSKSD